MSSLWNLRPGAFALPFSSLTSHVFKIEHWNWDTWTGEDQEDEEYGGEEEGEYGPHCEEDGFVVSWTLTIHFNAYLREDLF